MRSGLPPSTQQHLSTRLTSPDLSRPPLPTHLDLTPLARAPVREMFTSLAKGYSALSKAGQPQSELDIIDKLCDRLLNGTQLEDRRAALLGLKGLSRDWKAVSPPLLRLRARLMGWRVALAQQRPPPRS